ncbi:MAG: helix-turn-helix domain-containing protein [Candidatus Wallbacteria bacterium]
MENENKNHNVIITITAKQAARIIGISYWSLLEMCKRGEIPYIPIGKKRLFRQEALLRWLEEREQATLIKVA